MLPIKPNLKMSKPIKEVGTCKCGYPFTKQGLQNKT